MPHNGEAINVTKRETTNASQEGGDKIAHSWGDDSKMARRNCSRYSGSPFPRENAASASLALYCSQHIAIKNKSDDKKLYALPFR